MMGRADGAIPAPPHAPTSRDVGPYRGGSVGESSPGSVSWLTHTIHCTDDGGLLRCHSICAVMWGLVGDVAVSAERYRMSFSYLFLSHNPTFMMIED